MTSTDARARPTQAHAADSPDAAVEVSTVTDPDGIAELIDVLNGIWGRSGAGTVASVELLWTLARTGNYVAAARHGGRIVGGAIAFRAAHQDHPVLYSHVVGVAEDERGRGVGYALKHHQAGWARANGLDTVLWTFDPLRARNAHLNLGKLGAIGIEYLVDHYGPLSDAQNDGGASDRLLVAWPVQAPRVPFPDDVAALRERGAEVALDIDAGRPVLGLTKSSTVLCRIPTGYDSLRADAELATSWRFALRAVMVDAFARGLSAQTFTRDGWYVLARKPKTAARRSPW